MLGFAFHFTLVDAKLVGWSLGYTPAWFIVSVAPG